MTRNRKVYHQSGWCEDENWYIFWPQEKKSIVTSKQHTISRHVDLTCTAPCFIFPSHPTYNLVFVSPLCPHLPPLISKLSPSIPFSVLLQFPSDNQWMQAPTLNIPPHHANWHSHAFQKPAANLLIITYLQMPPGLEGPVRSVHDTPVSFIFPASEIT